MAQRISKILKGRGKIEYTDGTSTVVVTNEGARRGFWKVIPQWDAEAASVWAAKEDACRCARADIAGRYEE
jgi:hypothetical protein